GLISDYAARKAELGVMDFADQVAWAWRIASQPGSPAATAERAQHKAVLLDEFQDTSTLQIRFLSSLFAATPVMAVGDPNQAIYGWRGASAGALAEFTRRFPGPGGVPAASADDGVGAVGAVGVGDGASGRGEEVFAPMPRAGAGDGGGAPRRAQILTLSVARRNDRAILAAANRLADPLRQDLAEMLGRELGLRGSFELPRLAARPEAGPGDVRSGYFETDVEEAAHIAAYLDQEWAAHLGAAEPRTACVLVRKWKQAGALTRAFERLGLPFKVGGSGGLLDEPEVRDLVCALTASQDLSRGDAFIRLAASPRWALGVKDLDRLRDRARRSTTEDGEVEPLDVVEALAKGTVQAEASGLSQAGAHRLAALGEALRRIRAASAYLTVPELILAAERALGLDIDLLARSGPAARANVNQLVNQAHSYVQGQADASLTGFLDWLANEEKFGQGLAKADAGPRDNVIQVLSVHGAKGLEWDVVVVPGLSDGDMPGVAPDKDGRRLASGWLSAAKGSGAGELPWPMRLDRSSLPHFDYDGAADVVELAEEADRFREAVGRYQVGEDRRLAYVALTRAKTHLLVTGSWLAEGRATPRAPSLFLEELAEAAGPESPPALSRDRWASNPDGLGDSGVGEPGPSGPAVVAGGAPGTMAAASEATGARVAAVNQVSVEPAGWVEDGAEAAAAGLVPSDDAARPGPPGDGALPSALKETGAAAIWPGADPLGSRGPALAAAAAKVRRAREELGSRRLTPEEALERLAAIGGGLARDAALLVAEERGEREPPTVRLPAQASATSLIALMAAPEAQARRLRRPVPVRPSRGAAIGDQFHARVALELAHHARAAGLQGVLDPDAFAPLAQDSELDAAVEKLMAAWRASGWVGGQRKVWAVEAPVELEFGGHAVAARIDAVFEDRDGRLTVVDWKTERSKGGQVDPRHAGQVRFYQAALARARGLAPADIQAYVHYVPDNLSAQVAWEPAYLQTLEALFT
ncbi:MAG: UvrD-helicase domain-containing protein, partial [Bifidobacteriaceae bacterium]|nr:UvrD-helicase domain-containing protein [Bifidobacteriaceae bacterium]